MVVVLLLNNYFTMKVGTYTSSNNGTAIMHDHA